MPPGLQGNDQPAEFVERAYQFMDGPHQGTAVSIIIGLFRVACSFSYYVLSLNPLATAARG